MSFPDRSGRIAKKKPEEQSIPRSPPITWQEWQRQIVEGVDQGYTPNEVLNWTADEYAERRKLMELAMREQMYLPEHSHGLPQMNTHSQPLTRETLERAVDELRQHEDISKARSFISRLVEERIMEWGRQDSRVGQFWYLVTRRVRRGLNDEIVDGMMVALSTVLKGVDVEQDNRNTRNLDLVRSLGNAIADAVEAFKDAESRGDLEYMREAIEELDAARFAIGGKELPGDGPA